MSSDHYHVRVLWFFFTLQLYRAIAHPLANAPCLLGHDTASSPENPAVKCPSRVPPRLETVPLPVNAVYRTISITYVFAVLFHRARQQVLICEHWLVFVTSPGLLSWRSVISAVRGRSRRRILEDRLRIAAAVSRHVHPAWSGPGHLDPCSLPKAQTHEERTPSRTR